jgi:hypothetical protein
MSSGVFDSDFHSQLQQQQDILRLRELAAKHQAAMQQQLGMTGKIALPMIRELTICEADGGWILVRRGWPLAYSELVLFTDREKLIAAISEHFPERERRG